VLFPRPKRLDAVGVFLLALGLRVVHVWQIRRSPFFDVLLGDAHGYDEWARRIAGGEWIGRDVFYQAPLYPYFLGVIYALIGHSLLAVRLIQAVIGAASCALLVLAGRRFFSPTVGLIAGIGLAVYAPAIFFDGLLQKSVLDLFFLSLSLWLIGLLLDWPDDRRLWLSLGLAMGALSVTRENALVFIVVIVVWCLVRPQVRLKADTTTERKVRLKADTTTANRRSGVVSGFPPPHKAAARIAEARSAREGGRRTRQAAAFFLGLALVLLPVAIRNYAVGGGFYLTTSQFGPNFFIGNNPSADGTYMSLRFGRGAPEYERQDATELADHATGRTLTPSEVSSYWTSRALDFITAHPMRWLMLSGRKALLLINATEMLDTESQESYAEWSWPLRLLGWFGHFGVLVPLAVLGMVLSWRDRKRIGILYALTVSYAVSVLMFYVFARYRLPLVPLFMLFASSAIYRLPALRQMARERYARAPQRDSGLMISASSAVSALIVVTIFAVAANWPLLSKPLMMAITETNLAVALQAEGRPANAVEHYQQAIAIQPDYAPAYNNLGVAKRATGNIDEAIAAYRRAVAMNPEYPDAHYNLANALLDKNKPEEAAEHFRIALRSIPDSAGVSNNLGIALAAEGKGTDAIAAFRAAVAAEPGSAKAHRNLADALSSAGQLTEAFAEFQRAAELDPNDAATHYNFGSTLLEAGRFDEAIAEFRAALRVTPQSPEAHNNLGIALGSKGDLNAAIAEFQKALSLKPGFADAERNLEMARSQKR
jgi:tetratricopeptide (TPR) repeat protein